MTETFKIECEYTDTFGGDANYSWVRRAVIELPQDASERTIAHRIKKALGISGVRCKTYSHGDSWEYRPYGMCTVAFGTVQY